MPNKFNLKRQKSRKKMHEKTIEKK